MKHCNFIKMVLLLVMAALCCPLSAVTQTTLHIACPSSGNDATYTIRTSIENTKSKNLKIVLDKGTYFCTPQFASELYCAITNHGNGSKRILYHLCDYEHIEIVGNGATLLCHGQLMPFLFENCQSVKVSNLTINWDIPFTFLGEVVAVDSVKGWREIKPFTEGFSWKFTPKGINFPNIDGFNYAYLGSTLPFDKETKRVVRGAIDFISIPHRVEKLPNGNLKFYEELRYYPPVGSLLSSKGDREHDRYAPAFDFKSCRNITLEGITIHHALGMGFLFERSENIQILNSSIVLPPNSARVISTTADATHFANCKGDILIEGCRFQNMLDDGTNVHGTYMNIEKITGPRSLIASFMHFEQLGFNFAEPGDELWFIEHPSPERGAIDKVQSVKVINEKYIEYTFENELPKGLSTGDIIENKTWNPTFTMRQCTIQNHRARNVVLKTPLKTVIEGNHFSSMMSSILFRGESYFWFESGAVTDVLIQNNTFKNCADCGTPHAVLYITPKLGKAFDKQATFDRNIRFTGNTIDSYIPRVVWAENVEGLVIANNQITRNDEYVPVFPNAPVFELSNCKDVTIQNNLYKGRAPSQVLKADDASRKTLHLKKELVIKKK